jgi:hypothetical protein
MEVAPLRHHGRNARHAMTGRRSHRLSSRSPAAVPGVSASVRARPDTGLALGAGPRDRLRGLRRQGRVQRVRGRGDEDVVEGEAEGWTVEGDRWQRRIIREDRQLKGFDGPR